MPVPEVPQILTGDALVYAENHILEELQEAKDAKTIEDQADAWLDMAYVALGRLIAMGIIPGPAFDEVHRANMDRKPAGAGGKAKRGNSHDAVKPEGWTPPRLEAYCTITREEVDRLIADRGTWEAITRWEQERRLSAPRPISFAGLRPRKPKVLLLGYGRHGKDTAAEMLAEDFGLTHRSSSSFCAEHVVMPWLQEHEGWTYSTPEECFEHRHDNDNRAKWYQAIMAYNRPDASRLARAIFDEVDLYVGLRSAREFHAVKGAKLYDLCLWIDASGRGLPPEDRSSCTVEPWMADVVVDNSGDLDELRLNLRRVMETHLGQIPFASFEEVRP